MYKRLLDTDIFSEIAKGFDKELVRKAERYRAEIGYYTISAITVMEIMRGFYRRKLYSKAEEFRIMDNEILLPNTESYFLAGKIHGELLSTGQEIGSADVLIASISLTYQLPLVTGNTRHYSKIQELGYSLILENWKQ